MTGKKKKENTPYINRTIGNRKYTVLIHFKKGEKETAIDKVKRLLKSEIKNRGGTDGKQSV